MTPAQLRSRLVALLADQLGTYKPPGTSTTFPAIYVGEPPSDWTASGLEARIGPVPDFHNTPLQNAEHNLEETLLVRLVQHPGSNNLTTATRRVARAFTDAATTRIDGNEELGILDQVTIRIPT